MKHNISLHLRYVSQTIQTHAPMKTLQVIVRVHVSVVSR